MKKILLNLFILTQTFFTYSQTTSLIILDNIDGTPLENIKVENEDEVFFSNKDGEIVLENDLFPIDLFINDFRYYPKTVRVSKSQSIKIKLIHKGFILDDIVINSSFYPKKLKDNNTSASIIDDIEFRKNEGEFLINSLNQVTGVYSHSAGYNTN